MVGLDVAGNSRPQILGTGIPRDEAVTSHRIHTRYALSAANLCLEHRPNVYTIHLDVFNISSQSVCL